MATTSRDPEAVKAKIAQAVRTGDVRKALSLGEKLIKLPKASAPDCVSFAEFANSAGHMELTVHSLRQACRREPDDIELLFRLVEVERRAGLNKDGLAHLAQAQKLSRSADDLDRIANFMSRLGDVDGAAKIFMEALQYDPDNLHIKSNCAIAKAFLGETEEAEKLYDEIIEKGKTDGLTYLNRSWVRKQSVDKNHVDELKAAVTSTQEEDEKMPFLFYALTKELEDIGRHEEAFGYLERGAAGRRKQVTYDLKVDLADIQRIIETFDEDFFRALPKGYDSTEPIFILGMPRSGSTLIERIVGGHSKVFAAGELQNFRLLMRQHTVDAARRKGLYHGFDKIATVREIDFRTLGREYIKSTRPFAGHSPHFIDKLPNNYLYLGPIAAALPNAKIIHTCRNPMDVCYAMLKQPFLESYFFSYDQKELGEYYLAYRRLMEHWETMLPNRIINVHYEELVEDSERVAKGVIAQLGLEWEPACLDYTANREASATASAIQVRQPIYKTSVGKWRAFEDRLTVLRDTLEAGGMKVD